MQARALKVIGQGQRVLFANDPIADVRNGSTRQSFSQRKSDLAEDFRELVKRLIPTAFSGRARWNADMVHFHLGFAFAFA